MQRNHKESWQAKLHETIYESNTRAGKIFDIALLIFIFGSILVVMFDSIGAYQRKYGDVFFIVEWGFTALFTVEYILRLICIKRPLGYVFSFLGIIDLLAIIPSYLSIVLPGAQSLLVLRALRLLRIFRIFKLAHFLKEMQFLKASVSNSMKKISIFMLVVFILVIILGSIMYLVENG